MRVLSFLLLGLILAAGCNRETENRSRVIPEKKLIEVLKEIHIANAIIANPGYRIRYNIEDSSQVFLPIYAKYGITADDFERTMEYYSGKPEELNEIYESVLQELNEMEAEILSLDQEEGQAEKENLWRGARKLTYSTLGDTGKFAFEIPIESPGFYTIRIKLKMYMDDMSLNPRLSAFFWHSDSTEAGFREYFPERGYQKDGFNKYYSVSHSTTNPEITHLKGWFLNHDPQSGNWQKHLEIEDIEVYLEDKKPVPSLSRGTR